MQITIDLSTSELDAFVSHRRSNVGDDRWNTQTEIMYMQQIVADLFSIPFGDVHIECGISTMTMLQREAMINEIKSELQHDNKLNAIKLVRKYTECRLINAIKFIESPSLWDSFITTGSMPVVSDT